MEKLMQTSDLPHFIWKIESSCALPGETKAEIASKMESIAEAVSEGAATAEIFYAERAVGAKIIAKASPEMRRAAMDEARRISSRGISGLVAKVLFFVKGLDEETRQTVVSNIARKILLERCSARLDEVRLRLAGAVSSSSLSPFSKMAARHGAGAPADGR